MENKTNKEQIQQEKNPEHQNMDNLNNNLNEPIKNSNKLDTSRQNLVKINLNNKYENALLEELNNSKTKSWRIDITNATQEEELENKKNKNNLNQNEIKSNTEKEKEEIEKEDRFKDFDEILISEENKDKKRKNRTTDKIGKIPKPDEKRKNEHEDNNNIVNNMLNQENSNLNKNQIAFSELNRGIENNKINNLKDLDNKKKETNQNNDNNYNNLAIINHGKSNNLKEIINENANSTNENKDNKFKNINLEYSENKQSYEENAEKNNNINNNFEIVDNEKNSIENIYNNFIDLLDKNIDNENNNNDINRYLIRKNNIETTNIINKKFNQQLKVSKSYNIRKNIRGKKANNENKYIYPYKSQNMQRSLVCEKNTINIQLSIKRKTRSAKDIKKHMSYYLIDGKIKNPKNEINNITQFMNKYISQRSFNQNNLNSFLPLQISSNKINPKNNIKYNSTPFNILKNSFKDKIRKKMNIINTTKSHKTKTKNKYINLEFFEESKQDNFFGKTSKDFYEAKDKFFERKEKIEFEGNKFNFYKSQISFFNEQNKTNNIFITNPKINQSKDNNYFYKTYSSNMNPRGKRFFSYYSDEHKNLDYFKENNKIFGMNFNYSSNPIKKYDLQYKNSSNHIFNNAIKNIINPTIRTSRSYTSIFQNGTNNAYKASYSHIFKNNYINRNCGSNLIQRKTNFFYLN